jgi:hypothetical protein
MLFNDCLEKVLNDVFVILVFLVLHFINNLYRVFKFLIYFGKIKYE